MANIGDTVRFLSSTGGGVITRIDGKIAYVEEDGFETPVLLKELVVVLPAGHTPPTGGARLMFDQKAYDKGRANGQTQKPGKETPKAVSKDVTPKTEPKAAPAVQTSYGDKISLSLAFEPSDIKRLSESTFNAVLVNDSNYTLSFIFAGRRADEPEWSVIYRGEVEPNELIDLETFTHVQLGRLERVALQAVAFKADRPFGLKAPIDATRKLDLTKFHKLHCFRPGRYFDLPVLEFPILSDDTNVQAASASTTPYPMAENAEAAYEDSIARLKGKFESKDKSVKHKIQNPADNPNRLLPLIEVDLHIGNLTDTIAGMSNSDILEMQLDEVRKVMKAHSRRIGQKIVFIHGKGEGVLRKAVIALLKKEYPTATLQDASFREYGFGATLVTIHNNQTTDDKSNGKGK